MDEKCWVLVVRCLASGPVAGAGLLQARQRRSAIIHVKNTTSKILHNRKELDDSTALRQFMLLHFIFYTLFTHNIGHGLQPSEMTYYNYPHEKTIIHQDLDEIRTKLLNKSDEQKNVLQSCSALRVHSMRQNYSKDMLEQFYNEQMIPHFPLEDERDSLEDWIYCLDPEKVVTHDEQEKLWPVMDILLLVCDVNVNDESISSGDETDTDTDKTLIFAGVAFEYYQRAEVGLVSYVTVHSSFRKLGIMKLLHPLAIQALKGLHSESHWKRYGALPDHEIKV